MAYPLTEQMKVIGKTVILVRRADTEEVIKRIEKKNVVTDAGRALFASRIANPWQYGSGEGKWLVLGTGTGTPSPSDTGLFSPVWETAKQPSVSVSGNQITYHARYLPEEANGYTFTEEGIYDPGTRDPNTGVVSGTFIQHNTFDAIQKTENILLDVYVYIIIV